MVYYGVVLLTPSYFKAEEQSIYTSSLIGAFAEFPGLLVAILLVDRPGFGRSRTQAVLLALSAIGCLGLTGDKLGYFSLSSLTAFAVLAR